MKKSLLRGGGGLIALAVLAVPIFAMSASAGLKGDGGFSIRAKTEHSGRTLEHTVAGFGSSGTGSPVDPVDPGGEQNYSKIIVDSAAGNNFTLALADDGTVYSFGDNEYGQLGVGTTTATRTPTRVPSLSKIKSVDADDMTSAALDDAGNVYMWGWNNSLTPTKIEGLPKVKAFSISAYHGLAIAENGELWSWGDNRSGQRGIGTESQQELPTQVALAGVKQVSAANSASMVLLNDGSVYLFGKNEHGELGVNGVKSVLTPHKVPVSDIAAIDAGYRNFFMLDNAGKVHAMGLNSHYELGLGHNDPVTTPTIIELPSPIAKVFAAYEHTLVVTTSGDLFGFGNEVMGWYPQEDDGSGGTLPYIQTPIQVALAENGISTIGAGMRHTVVVMANGEMRALGTNYAGELGAGEINSNQGYRFSKIEL